MNNSIIEKMKKATKVMAPMMMSVTGIMGIAIAQSMLGFRERMDNKEIVEDLTELDTNNKVYANTKMSIDYKVKQMRVNNSKPIHRYEDACDRYYSWMNQSNTKEIYEAYEEYKEFGN